MMHLFALLALVSSARAGLIGLGDPTYSARADPTGPVVARAPPARASSSSPDKDSDRLAVLGLNGTGSVVSASSPPLAYTEDAIDPGCNAAYRASQNVYYKTTSNIVTFEASTGCDGFGGCAAGAACCVNPAVPTDTPTCYAVDACSELSAGDLGVIVTIDAASGRALANASMSAPYHPPFGAFSEADGVMLSLVPTDYFSLSLVAYDVATGAVEVRHTLEKGQLDGVAVCEGLVLSTTNELVYAMSNGDGDYLLAIDTGTYAVRTLADAFYGPLAEDPTAPGAILALHNIPKGGLELVRIDAATGAVSVVLRVASTSLGSDLRAQDQAGLAIAADGSAGWFLASYNLPDGSLARGMFTVAIDAQSGNATLVDEQWAFGGDATGGDGAHPWIGKLDWAP